MMNARFASTIALVVLVGGISLHRNPIDLSTPIVEWLGAGAFLGVGLFVAWLLSIDGQQPARDGDKPGE